MPQRVYAFFCGPPTLLRLPPHPRLRTAAGRANAAFLSSPWFPRRQGGEGLAERSPTPPSSRRWRVLLPAPRERPPECVLVGVESALGLLVRSSWREKKPRNDEVRGHAIRQGELLDHRRHPRPRIEDMGNAMLVQNVEILRLEEVLVLDLDPVLPPRRQLIQKGVERCHEITAMLKVALVEL